MIFGRHRRSGRKTLKFDCHWIAYLNFANARPLALTPSRGRRDEAVGQLLVGEAVQGAPHLSRGLLVL
jgi:hypothetical protein